MTTRDRDLETASAALHFGRCSCEVCYFFAPDGMVFDLHDPLKYGHDDTTAEQRANVERIAALRLRGFGAEKSGQRPAGSQMANARFVEGARTDVPALLAEVRRLRAVLSSIATPRASVDKESASG